jgi:hypothetical protein
MWGAPGSKAKGPQPLNGRIYLAMTFVSDATQTTGIDRGEHTRLGGNRRAVSSVGLEFQK